MLTKDLTLHIDDGDTCLTLDTKNPLLFEKEVIYVGNFAKWKADGTLEYQFSVDEKDIDHWVQQHSLQLEAGVEVVMPEEHTAAPSARRATALELTKKRDSKGRLALFVKGQFKDEESLKALKDSNVSLYCPPQFKHGTTTFTRPIRHIAFTDNPVIGGLDKLQTIAASYVKEKSMSRKLAEKFGITVPENADDAAIESLIETHVESLRTPSGVTGLANSGSNGTPSGTTVAASTATIAASAAPDPIMAGLVRDNRRMQVEGLVAARKLLPAEAKPLIDNYAGQEISLSTETTAAFGMLISTIGARQPIELSVGGERSGAQKRDPNSTNSLKAAAQKLNAAKKR